MSNHLSESSPNIEIVADAVRMYMRNEKVVVHSREALNQWIKQTVEKDQTLNEVILQPEEIEAIISNLETEFLKPRETQFEGGGSTLYKRCL